MQAEKICLSAMEISELTGLSMSMVRKLTRNGEIPHIRVGRRILYPTTAIEKWLTQRIVGSTVLSENGDVNG